MLESLQCKWVLFPGAKILGREAGDVTGLCVGARGEEGIYM